MPPPIPKNPERVPTKLPVKINTISISKYPKINFDCIIALITVDIG
jgi:hypothetical protein